MLLSEWLLEIDACRLFPDLKKPSIIWKGIPKMPNKSHFNNGHMTLNRLNRMGKKPNGTAPIQCIEKTLCGKLG
jgi:hypothetical protein